MKSITLKLFLLFITVFVLQACDRDWTSPYDPSYEVPPPTLLNVEPIIDPEPQIEIRWKNNEEYTEKFDIWRKTNSGDYNLIATVAKTHLSYIDDSCVFGVVYSYVVISVFADKSSPYSNSLTAPALIPQPSELNFNTLSDSEISITWVDNCSFEEGFLIERKNGDDFHQVADLNANLTEYSDSGLEVGQTYDYRVAAYTFVNTSSWTIISTVTDFPAPTDLSVTLINDSEIQLSWVENTDYESGFNIERDAGSGFIEIASVSADVTEYSDTGLTVGQVYDYRVAAYTSVNTSSWTSITTVTDFPAPTDLSATGMSDTEIQLNWTDNTTYESGFKIERDAGNGFTEIVSLSADATEYIDTGLTYGESYKYRVSAYTISNTSDFCFPAVGYACSNCISDFDGNIYETIQIGDQIWMAENLKVTHYRDGTPIPNLTSDLDWTNTNSGAYCFYENNVSNADMYGALYNNHIMDNSISIAPEGWHVSTYQDWEELINYLADNGYGDVYGYVGKSLASTSGWEISNVVGNVGHDQASNNSSGFTWVPGGLRSLGGFGSIGSTGGFWSRSNVGSAYYKSLSSHSAGVGWSLNGHQWGNSIRLVKN
jgi:uncharacterized protein (TIGR02145 family)